MNFKDFINLLEDANYHKDYILKVGEYPILFTAPHTMEQIRKDGSLKYAEAYTKAIALYLHDKCGTNCLIKIHDTGIDSNRDYPEPFKDILVNFVKNNNIKLVIDLHGAARERDFDVEFGTLHNLSADYSTIKELEEAFTENGIFKVAHNDPFRGGAITKYMYNIKDVDVIQLEINCNYLDGNNIDKLETLVNCLEKFVKQYIEYLKK